MEIRQLQYFATIARLGGFRRAADELSVREATLSEQIKYLERELGVRLFERSRRSLVVTAAGETLLARAEHILGEFKAARTEMQEFAHLDRGEVALGAPRATGMTWLPEFLASFVQRHPGIEVSLVERSSMALVKLVETQQIHVAYLHVPAQLHPLPAGLSLEPLLARNLVAVVSPRHRLAGRATVCLEELAGQRLILPSPDEYLRVIVEDSFRVKGLELIATFESDDPSTVIGLAAQGLGIGVVGQFSAEANRERVVSLRVEGDVWQYVPALAWSDRAPRTRALERFLRFAGVWLRGWFGLQAGPPLVESPRRSQHERHYWRSISTSARH